MAAVSETIIDAIVTRLNAASFTETFTASKKLFPRVELENISATVIDIYAGSVEYTKQNRAADYQKTYEIKLVVLSPLTADTNAAISPFLELAEEVKADLSTQLMAGLPLVEIESDDSINFELIQTAGLISILINLKYRGL